MHEEKVDMKLGRDYRNLSHHSGMVHLHSGLEHLSNVDVEVIIEFSSINIFILTFVLCNELGQIGEGRTWIVRIRAISGIVRRLWRQGER